MSCYLQQRIFGWKPAGGEDHVEVPPRPARPQPQILTSQISRSSNGTSHQSSPVGDEPSPPSSSVSSHPPKDGFNFSEPVRRGDPTWVARPRNPFIIFRCEYSRKHCKEGKRVRRPVGAHVEQTLSKRAGDAWRLLSDEERYHFKVLADKERDEHARLHPNYRFRPMKRGSKRPLKRTPDPPPSPQKQSPVAAPVPQYPPTLATPEPPPPPPVDMAAVKATRRRSASVPSLPIGQYPFISGIWTTLQPIRVDVDIKRARSATGNRVVAPPSTPYDGLSFDPRLPYTSSALGFYPSNEDFSSDEFLVDSSNSAQDSPVYESQEENTLPLTTRGGGRGVQRATVDTRPSLSSWASFSEDGPFPQYHETYLQPEYSQFEYSRPECSQPEYSQPDNTEDLVLGVRNFGFVQGVDSWPEPPSSHIVYTPPNSQPYYQQFGVQDYTIGVDSNHVDELLNGSLNSFC